MSGFLELKGLAKRFGTNTVLENLDLSVKEGEFLVLVGPSGCGKSTVLRLISGLEEPTEGEVLIDGKSMRNVEPKDRDIAMVFQSYALYPHMNVFENMAFGLRMGKRLPEAEIRQRVMEAAELLKIEKYLQRKPKDLSGGQRQRVALGRALVRKPKVFLFDEPLSNLDAHLRNQMRAEIRKIQQRLGVTSIYVTHDQVEATTMGDRIAVLQGGRLQQLGTPAEVYRQPVNAFVAGFIGTPEMNFLEGEAGNGRVKAAGHSFAAPANLRGLVRVGVRPESLLLAGGEGAAGKVELVEDIGSHALVHVRLQSGPSVIAMVPSAQAPALRQDLKVNWQPADARFFAHEGGEALGGAT